MAAAIIPTVWPLAPLRMRHQRKLIALTFIRAYIAASSVLAHYELGQALVQKHMYKEAVAELQKAIELSGGSTTCTSNLAFAYAASGRRKEAVKILNDLKNRSKQNASEIALMYVGLYEKDQAMTWLEKAYEERFNPSILLRPAFDPLRSDPRFQNLVRRIGLPS